MIYSYNSSIRDIRVPALLDEFNLGIEGNRRAKIIFLLGLRNLFFYSKEILRR